MYRNTNPILPALLLLASLACVREVSAQLPGVQVLPSARLIPSAGQDSRLVVGDDDSACLAWTWKAPTSPEDSPGGEATIYPGPRAGTLGKVDSTWTLDADGTVTSPQSCIPGGRTSPFPELGLGPLGELWFLAASDTGPADAWAVLLHTVEAAYRQSGMEKPLGETTIGQLGECAIRSFPVDLKASENQWSPIELSESVSVGRFFWWVDAKCVTADSTTPTLRLFPIPDTETGETGKTGHFLTVNAPAMDSASSPLPYSRLAPERWSPRVRARIEAPESDVLTLPLAFDPQAAPADLCSIPGLAEACRRSSRARRQLFTVADLDADPPWPPARRDAVQNHCRAALEGRATEDACSAAASWHQRLAGELVAVFDEDIVLSESPRILEKWQNNRVVWQVDNPAALAISGEVEIELLGGGRVLLQPQPIQPKPIDADTASSSTISWLNWLTASLAVLATILAGIALLRTSRAKKSPNDTTRRELLLLIERALDRRLPKVLPKPATSGDLATERQALDSVIQDALRLLNERAAEIEQRLEGHISGLATSGLAASGPPSSGPPASGPPASRPPASEPPGPMASRGDPRALCRDIVDLDSQQDGRITDALRAAGDLGYWIEILWPSLQEAAGTRVDTVADDLPEPAAAEWSHARGVLESFAAHDAPALRWLARRLDDGEAGPSAESVFLENSGLLDAEVPVVERLKHYLVPSDELGRLGEITLALQYLVEAYPIEQLKPTEQTRLSQGLAEAVQSMRLVESFHHLVARVAGGVGLDYRPVPYYKSRLDQSEYAFVRQQVSPISLSERVGFDAKADPAVIVRLDRPFFVQSANQVYYSGHAHVARD